MTTRTRRGAEALAALLLGASVAGCAGSGPAPTTHGNAASPSGARGFTLVASGDVLPHDSVVDRAHTDAGGDGYDFRPMLAAMKPIVSDADLAICHIDTVYGEDDGHSGHPDVTSPPQIADALRDTGYDSCSTASHQSLDDGAEGIGRTLEALDKAGVKHAGSARSAAEAKGPTWLRAGPAKVAHLAYTYGTNDNEMPEGKPWSVNLIDRDKIVADARAARKAGADVVVVSLDWGTERQDDPDERQLTLGKQLTASKTNGRPDIDLMLGTHAHIPQPYEKVNGTWIVYGMGDQIAGEMFSASGARDLRGNEGSVARFTFEPPARPGERWRVTKAEFVPHYFDIATGRVIDVNAAIDNGDSDLRRVRNWIREVVLSRGAAKDGLEMAGQGAG